MVKFLVLIVIITLVISCGEITGDDPVDWNELLVNCIPSEYEIKEFSSCDSSISYNPSFICDYINLGNYFLLPETKQQSKYMCSLIVSVTFENEKGDEITFQKTAFAGQYATQWSEICDNNLDKSILFCSSNEEATAILTNDSLGLEFRIMLIIDTRDEDKMGNDRDRLYITVPKITDFGNYYFLVLSYYIKRGYVYESFNPEYIYEEQFELNGETYPDVTYFKPSEDDDNRMEIYYSAKYGIIGFRDEKGVLWIFKRFG